MYIPRSVLILMVFIFLVFLVGADWMTDPESHWYRPFLVAFAIIIFSAWSQHSQKNDDY